MGTSLVKAGIGLVFVAVGAVSAVTALSDRKRSGLPWRQFWLDADPVTPSADPGTPPPTWG